jgi:hypothetical protein
MTSQLNVDTIVDKAGSGGTNVKVANTSTYVSDGGAVTQNTVQGIGKMWCSFNGEGTIAIRDSFNIDSLTDNGTGSYDQNFTNNMVSDTWASSITANVFMSQIDSNPNTSQLHATTRNVSNSVTDCSYIHSQIDGDLA